MLSPERQLNGMDTRDKHGHDEKREFGCSRQALAIQCRIALPLGYMLGILVPVSGFELDIGR